MTPKSTANNDGGVSAKLSFLLGFNSIADTKGTHQCKQYQYDDKNKRHV
jgi:hypothetical protein